MVPTLVENPQFFYPTLLTYFALLLTGEPTQSASKESNGAICSIISNIVWKWSIHYTSISAMSNPLQWSKNQEQFEKHPRNQNSHYDLLNNVAYPSYISYH